MPKVIFQLYLEVDQYDYILKKSEITGNSRASIVRKLIEKDKKEDENGIEIINHTN